MPLLPNGVPWGKLPRHGDEADNEFGLLFWSSESVKARVGWKKLEKQKIVYFQLFKHLHAARSQCSFIVLRHWDNVLSIFETLPKSRRPQI